MLIVEYYLGEKIFYVDKATGHVPQKGDMIIDPFSQTRFQVLAVPEFWVARQTVRMQVGSVS